MSMSVVDSPSAMSFTVSIYIHVYTCIYMYIDNGIYNVAIAM